MPMKFERDRIIIHADDDTTMGDVEVAREILNCLEKWVKKRKEKVKP